MAHFVPVRVLVFPEALQHTDLENKKSLQQVLNTVRNDLSFRLPLLSGRIAPLRRGTWQAPVTRCYLVIE